MLISMGVFSFLVILIFNFALPLDLREADGILPGVLWVAYIFSGLLAMGRSFGAEKDRGSFQGLLLCPVERGILYAGKMMANLIFMSMIEVFTVSVFIVLFNVKILPVLLPLALIILLGSLGFAVIGTIFSAISAHTQAREVMLSLLVLPICIPLVIASVKATGAILSPTPFSEIFPWLRLLAAFDMTFLFISYLTFEFVIEE
jgi:heme exporter protein B